MSTVITATCSQCNQPADIPAEAVLLDLDGHTVSWVCAVCGDLEEQQVALALLPRLLDGGVSLISSRNAHATGHPETPPTGSPFTLDDVLAMHELLAGPSWLETLERATSTHQPADAADAA